ncbi:MAG TPA: formate dehydrogenase accessory sulfurtransferase FdhD [Acidimicrobiales bacterium]|nr:formate dehydrogenase accessory sulfurtransferase FdhD [Acidimicrobiales bacterium]
MASTRPGPTSKVRAWEVVGEGRRGGDDTVATEEPMEIRLVAGGLRRPVAVTMRTPGNDFELAAGFLFNEGVIREPSQLRAITYCVDGDVPDQQRYNIVNVEVKGATATDLAPLERHFSMTSACGVCGKATLDALGERGLVPLPPGPCVGPELIWSLPDRLREAQRVFESTGGLHATGLFGADGTLVALREDVGRHNAMDKVVGWALMHGRVPLRDHVLLVSGRASFELVQKALSAGVPVLCSVSAPSSLAVDLAREFGLTLVGFLRDRRFKIYSCPDRIGAG